MLKKKILIASDHAGFKLKEELKKYLESKKYKIFDCGPDKLEKTDDYPDFAHRLSGYIKLGKAKQGILICGSGIGMSMAANRHKNIRAALCINPGMAESSRKHNDANVLVLGGSVTTKHEGEEILDIFLNTKFEGGRHKRRIDKI